MPITCHETSQCLPAIPGAGVPCNEIPELPEDVATNFHHVLMAGRGLQGLWGEEGEAVRGRDAAWEALTRDCLPH